jgi:hypothetical protein
MWFPYYQRVCDPLGVCPKSPHQEGDGRCRAYASAPSGAFTPEADGLRMSVSVVEHLIPPRMLRSRRGGDDRLRLVAPTIRDGAPAGGCEADGEAAED